MSALGDTFRTMRESQGLTLSDVADRIHIRSVYLAAIEAEDWTSIGPPVYVRGFLRSYARCLGLDADAAVAQFSRASGAKAVASVAATSASAVASPPRKPRREPARVDRGEVPKRGLSLGALAGVVVAFALVLFVGYEYMEFSRGETVPASGVSPAPSAAAQPTAQPQRAERELPAPVVPPRAGPKNEERASGFAVRLRDSSWLRVVVDGKVAMEGLYPKGTERTFSGRSATVRVGNAGGVDIFVDGRDLGPMGGLGDVAERSYQLEAR